MTEMERTHARDFIAQNRVAELQSQLRVTEDKLEQLMERLTLSPRERSVLDGRPDGCVLVGDLRPIVRRVFGENLPGAA
jgi:hypothetical protein